MMIFALRCGNICFCTLLSIADFRLSSDSLTRDLSAYVIAVAVFGQAAHGEVSMNDWLKLLPDDIAACIQDPDGVTEVRLRAGKRTTISRGSGYAAIGRTATSDDIASALAVSTDRSVYASESLLAQGFLTYKGGVRIGVCGECVYKGGKLSAYRTVSSLCIRVPHEIDFNDKRVETIVNRFENTLIISPPGMGKTTLLRYMVKRLSDGGKNVLIIDERNEISASVSGVPTCNIGANSDVVLYANKRDGYVEAIRAMRPDVLATDELFGKHEIDCIADAVRCGVRTLATVHSDSAARVLADPAYGALAAVTRYFVLLTGKGVIASVYDGVKKNCIL